MKYPRVVPGCDSWRLVEAIATAALDGSFVVMEPGQYFLDAPLRIPLDSNLAHPWGILAPGVALIAEYDAPEPLLCFDATGNAVARFLSIEGLQLRAKNRGQHGLVLRALQGGAYIYSFDLTRVSVEGADDAIRLEGNVFEGELVHCYGRDSNCGLALGNTDTGILSAINVWGGSYSQNKVDAIRTFAQTQWREPFDFSIHGSYLGNNGRYAVCARGGITLMSGVRMENPWSDLVTHDPEGNKERAAIYLCNFGVINTCDTGGNGNMTTLIDAYLNGTLVVHDARLWGATAKKLARLDGAAGNSEAFFYNSKGTIEASANVGVTQTT